MKRSWLFLFLISTSFAFASGTEDCDDNKLGDVKTMMKAAKMAADEGGCPNAAKLKNICMTIDRRSEDNSLGDNYKFLYQKKIIEASCADPNKDSETVIASKISTMWNKFSDKMKCNNTQFDVTNGSIIKYAVLSNFDEFLYDVKKWKVNLNKVDDSDNRTVLDYIKYQMERNKGNAVEEQLKYYYKLLRDAGAKHKSEL